MLNSITSLFFLRVSAKSQQYEKSRNLNGVFGLKINEHHWFRPKVEYNLILQKLNGPVFMSQGFPSSVKVSTYEILKWPRSNKIIELLCKNNSAIRYDDYQVTTSPLRKNDWLKYSLTHLKCEELWFFRFTGHPRTHKIHICKLYCIRYTV